MRIKVFPCDLEGVGCYRIVYPYGMVDANTSVQVTMEYEGDLVQKTGRTIIPIPPAATGGAYDMAAAMFLDADAYVLQRPLELPYAPLAAWLKENGKKVIVDLDDWMHGIPTQNRGARAIMRSNRHSLDVLTHCLSYADMLTVSTPRLAELYSNRIDNIEILPNYLLRQDWEAIEPSFGKERGRVRVGWMGWMDFRARDLRILKPVLQRWLRSHPEAVFVNVGKQDALEYLAVPADQRIHVPGARFPSHARPTSEIDIGLAPLSINSFNECKSALKGMEYGAVGACVIATPSGPYKEWVEGDYNGYLARNTDEWLKALDAAVVDWRRLAKANWEKAHEHMINDHWPEWLAAYGLKTKERVAA